MILLLEAAVSAAPDRVAVVTREGSTSYRELLHRSRCVATGLRRRQINTFAIVEPDAARVIALLAGAALVGAEPCQYQPDTDPSELATHMGVLGHSTVVSRRDDLPASLHVIRPEELTADEPDGGAATDAPQPLTIRTTGTTGLPKAARHDWRVLGQTVASVRPAAEQRWLLAYGPHQFAGIQVLLHVLACQGTLVAPFPRQPRDGLEALLNDGVTCVSATPTFWRFLLAEARSRKVELPRLQQVTLGGEASPADLLEEIMRTFPGAGVSQVYASTEFGSVTSVRDGLPGLAVDSLFSEANPTSSVRVQDGELWVRAEAGMLGYVGDDTPDASHDPSDASGADWKQTGDLVEIVGDRVIFRGRQSEVINVGGVKVHPLPVEERITALDSVAMARVFGRPNKLTGAIVAVEIVPTGGAAGAEVDKIRFEVKAAVEDLPRAWHPRSITFVDSIETRGTKTVRGMEEP
jgi:acyl-CoA synthetase (AMP-forming)/AMP-acid ligase II